MCGRNPLLFPGRSRLPLDGPPGINRVLRNDSSFCSVYTLAPLRDISCGLCHNHTARICVSIRPPLLRRSSRFSSCFYLNASDDSRADVCPDLGYSRLGLRRWRAFLDCWGLFRNFDRFRWHFYISARLLGMFTMKDDRVSNHTFFLLIATILN